MKALECLLECVNSTDAVTKNAFLKMYTKLDPMIFRKLFSFQAEMYRFYHKERYRASMLNMSEADPYNKTDSGFIIEIGCLAYALLFKIDEFHSTYRQDKRYNKMLMSIMPAEVRNDIPFSNSSVVQLTEFFAEIIKRSKRMLKPFSLNFPRAEKNALDDAKVNKYMRFYADITSQIDILVDGKLINYTFILLPYCRLSSTKQKEDFLEKLDRSSPQAKCESLMEESQYLIKEMIIDYKLKNHSTEVGKLLLKYQVLWKNWFLLWIFLTNACILASYSELNGSRRDDPKFYSMQISSTKNMLRACGIILSFFWMLACFPVFLTTAWMISYKYDIDHDKQDLRDQINSKGKIFTNTTVLYVVKLKGFIIKLFRILTNLQMFYLLILAVCIVLGLILHPFCYTILISYLIVVTPQMNNLLKALWEPRFAIMGTIALMFLLMYFFALYAYNRFPHDYPSNDCFDLWTCLVSSLDHTLKAAGIGNYIQSSYTEKSNYLQVDYERVIFDLLEFLLITILLISIISGIIIDKFSELRIKREENDKDAKSSCFICGRNNKDIDRDLTCPDFNTHIKLQHNIWDYVYFIAYLRFQEEHNPAGFSALEKYAINKMNKNDPSWFPSYQE